jgi:hypothetical protein
MLVVFTPKITENASTGVDVVVLARSNDIENEWVVNCVDDTLRDALRSICSVIAVSKP